MTIIHSHLLTTILINILLKYTFLKSNVGPTGSAVGSAPKFLVESMVESAVDWPPNPCRVDWGGSAMGSALISMSGGWRCRQWDRLPIPCRVDGGIGNGISRQLYAELMVESVVDWPKIPCRVGGEVWCAGSMVDNLHQFRARSMVVAAVQSVQISSPLEKALLRCMSLCVGCPSSLVG